MKNSKQTNSNKPENEVLFQKVGNTWYVFTEINSEVYYSALPEGMEPHSTKLELYQVIEEHMKKVAQHHRRHQTAA